ncbi:MAG TPA: sulfotransferase domain-containing protein [Bryobacteraceae bacterium]|nr:sulfotransferase domain-containing protein [Bryobacteraceae bacterium]
MSSLEIKSVEDRHHRSGEAASERASIPIPRRAAMATVDSMLRRTRAGLTTLAAATERLERAKFKLRYSPRADDIFIATYPKSGTTLVQMALYQLLTDGNMEIPHLNFFVPYLEDLIKSEIDASRIPSPRIAKTHVRYRDIPKGAGRYLYIIRDGRDVAVSYYYHYLRNGYSKGFGEFYEQFINGTVRFGRWFDHVAEWSENRARLKILFLKFEDLLADLKSSLGQIAAFCDISVAEPQWPRILRNCSFEFMREHEAKLDVKTRKSTRIDSENNHFIRKGSSGSWIDHFDRGMLDRYRLASRPYLDTVPAIRFYDSPAIHKWDATEPAGTMPDRETTHGSTTRLMGEVGNEF